MLVCVSSHNFAHETAGAARTRLSLRPLIFWGGVSCTTRAHRAAGAHRLAWLALGFRSNQRDRRKVVSVAPLIASEQRQVFNRCVGANKKIRQYAGANTAGVSVLDKSLAREKQRGPGYGCKRDARVCQCSLEI